MLLEQYKKYLEGKICLHYCFACIITPPFRWNISAPHHPARVYYCLTVTTENKNNKMMKGTLMELQDTEELEQNKFYA